MGNHTKTVLVPMSVSDKKYEERYNKAFGKSKGRKKNCNGCNYLTMDINPTCARCNERELYQKSLGSIYAEDVNVGRDNDTKNIANSIDNN